MQNYLSYLPEFFSGIREFNQIAAVVDSAVNSAYNDISAAINGLFPDAASGELLSRRERELGIYTYDGESEAERRRRVLTVCAGPRPYTFANLGRKLALLYGDGNFTVSRDTENHTLSVAVTSDDEAGVAELTALLPEIYEAAGTVSVTRTNAE